MLIKSIEKNGVCLKLVHFMNMFRIYKNNELYYTSEIFNVVNVEYLMLSKNI